jgi:hypothetical protein
VSADAQNITTALHETSLTPQTNYSEIPRVRRLIDKVLLSEARGTKYPSLDDNDIAETVYWMLRFPDTPDTLRAIYRIYPALEIIMNNYFNILDVDAIMRAEFTSVLHEFFSKVEAQEDDFIEIYNKRPFMYESPLLYFHVQAHFFSALHDGTKRCPIYEKYVTDFHEAIRIYQKKVQNNPSAYHHRTLASRHFFRYLAMDQEYKNRPVHDHPDIDSPEFDIYLNDFAKIFSDKTKGKIPHLPVED